MRRANRRSARTRRKGRACGDRRSAIPYLLGTNPCGPSNLLSSQCIGALQGAAGDIAAANTKLANVTNLMNNFESHTLGPVGNGTSLNGQLTGLLPNPNPIIKSLFAPNGTGGCSVNVLTDCNYNYTTYFQLDPKSGMPVIDEYACKIVNNNAWSFLHLPMKTYYAIGHTTATLAPLSSAYNTATLGNALQTTAALYPSAGGTAASVLGDISAMNINSQFFTAVAAPPPTVVHSVTDVCPAVS